MIAIARYLLAAHLRGRALLAPSAVSLTGVLLIYSVAPNPVLPTAGSAAAFLFFAQLWLSLAFFNGQADADRQMLVAAVGSSRLAAGRLLAGGLLATATAVIAVAYPTVAGRFDQAPTVGQLVVALAASVGVTTSASSLAALFSRPAIENHAAATLGLALCGLLSVPLGFPAVAIARTLNTSDTAGAAGHLAIDLGLAALFLVLATMLGVVLWRRGN